MLSTEDQAALARRLKARRRRLLAALSLPSDGLPGSLALTHRRCRPGGCHCQRDGGHPSWTLTYMVEGKKRVDYIPHDLIDEVRERVEAGNAYKKNVAELMAINAQLFTLWRRQRKRGERPGEQAGR